MSERSCKFCGETDHNIRTCGQAAKSRALVQSYAEIIQSKVQPIIEKEIPFSGFEGSMLVASFEFNKERFNNIHSDSNSSNPTAPSTLYSLFGYDCVSCANENIRHALQELGVIDFRSSWGAAQHLVEVAFPSIKSQDYKIGFFVEKDVYHRVGESVDGMVTISEMINFKTAEYVQQRLEEPNDNNFKKIWQKFCLHSSLKDNYAGWEGHEGELICALFKSVSGQLQNSAMKKRLPQSKLFSLVASKFGDAPRLIDLGSTFGISGEWLKIDNPEISITFNEGALADLPFKMTEQIKAVVEEEIKKAISDVIFSRAKQEICSLSGRSWRRQNLKNELYFKAVKTLLESANAESPVHGAFFTSIKVEDGFIYEKKPPLDVIENFQNSCKINSNSANSFIQDLVKMAHSGGYNQAFEKGKMNPFAFRAYLGERKFLKEVLGGRHENSCVDAYGVYYQYNCNLLDSERFTLGEIMVAMLESLVYSDTSIAK